jgi:hypothetical protein
MVIDTNIPVASSMDVVVILMRFDPFDLICIGILKSPAQYVLLRD